MLYTKTLTRMLDDVFSFPTLNLDAQYAYDEVTSDKNGTTIKVVVPGFSKEDLHLTVSDNYLNLSSKLENKKLSCSWKLADLADTKAIKANCKNGILTINISLKTKTEKASLIDIE